MVLAYRSSPFRRAKNKDILAYQRCLEHEREHWLGWVEDDVAREVDIVISASRRRCCNVDVGRRWCQVGRVSDWHGARP
jgi:hypothetical protein